MGRILLAVALAGAFGGLANAALQSQGLVLPALVTVQGSRVIVPGVVGNTLVGAIASLLSYGLYGPFVDRTIVGIASPVDTVAPRLTLAAFAGAILVGYSGGRWLSAEADSILARGTTAQVTQVLEQAVTSSPTHAWEIPKDPRTQKARQLLDEIRSASPQNAYSAARELRALLMSPSTTASRSP